jgi:integrase
LQASWIDYGNNNKLENTDCELINGLVSPSLYSEACTTKPAYQATICIPSTHTKNKRSHTFPIGSMCLSLLTQCSTKDTTSYLFPARGSKNSPKPFNGWSKAKAQLDKKVGDKLSLPLQPWTLHDLRRTFATNLQRLSIKLEVIEALLNHVSGTRAGITGVYQRHRYEAEMREAANSYEAWFTKNIIGGTNGSLPR